MLYDIMEHRAYNKDKSDQFPKEIDRLWKRPLYLQIEFTNHEYAIILYRACL